MNDKKFYVNINVSFKLTKTIPCNFWQDISKGLKELLEYEGNVQEDFGLTFQVRYIWILYMYIFVCVCVCVDIKIWKKLSEYLIIYL